MSRTTTRQRPNAAVQQADEQRQAAEAQALAQAIAFEQAIAEEALAIRGEQSFLTPALFVQLWPLLRRPIPTAFIQHVGEVTGKPYESTGVRSVQVQIDRMDNVLSPFGWRDEVEYHEEGRLARVRVSIISKVDAVSGEAVLASREAWGGVNRASSTGNLYKGSYTNAAKLAFARIGPAHEIYLGAPDFDPDVHRQSAVEQGKVTPQASVSPRAEDEALNAEQRARVLKGVEDAGYDTEGWNMLLAAVGCEDTDKLTVAQAFKIRELVDEKLKADGATANGDGS